MLKRLKTSYLRNDRDAYQYSLAYIDNGNAGDWRKR